MTAPDTHPHDDLAVYALDALEPSERAAVNAHLAGCAECRAELDAYRSTLGQMTVPEEPPDHLWEGISRQLGSTPVASGEAEAEAEVSGPEVAGVPGVVTLESRRRAPTWLRSPLRSSGTG